MSSYPSEDLTSLTLTNDNDISPPQQIEPQPTRDVRPNINIMFLGQVDSGKSTLCRRILIDTANVDDATVDKFKDKAQKNNWESWYPAYLFSHIESRDPNSTTHSITSFKTPNRRITLLETPRNSALLPDISQPDMICIVVSAQEGEFEVGNEKNGQTFQHILLARAMGISKIIVLINKMDLKWSQARFDEISSKLAEKFQNLGYNSDEDVVFCPISAYTGSGIKDRINKNDCLWYNEGPSFFDLLDTFPPIRDGPVRFTVFLIQTPSSNAPFTATITGKLHYGLLNIGDELVCVPNKTKYSITAMEVDSVGPVELAQSGENITLTLTSLDKSDVDIIKGSILCPVDNLCHQTEEIEVEIKMIGKLLVCGMTLSIQIHSTTVDCQLKSIATELAQNGDTIKEHPVFLREGSCGVVRLKLNQTIAVEKIHDFPSLASFILRDSDNGGSIVAIGNVLRLKPQ